MLLGGHTGGRDTGAGPPLGGEQTEAVGAQLRDVLDVTEPLSSEWLVFHVPEISPGQNLRSQRRRGWGGAAEARPAPPRSPTDAGRCSRGLHGDRTSEYERNDCGSLTLLANRSG